MRNRRFAAVLAGICVLILGPPAFAVDGLLMTTACGGGGISGTFTKNGVSVQFLSCLENGVLHTRVASASGSPMTETFATATDVTIYIAGILVAPGNSSTELDQMQAIINSASASAAAALPAALKQAGFSGTEPVLRGIVGHSVIYENTAGQDGGGGGCMNPATNCRGCCGRGCTGCLGICTTQCGTHDDCIVIAGERECLHLLRDAIMSALGCCLCQGSDCTCCYGIGPGC